MVEWAKAIWAFFGFGKQIAKNKAKKLEHREVAIEAEARKDASRKDNRTAKNEFKGKKKSTQERQEREVHQESKGMKAVITRTVANDKETLGMFHLYDEMDLIFTCCTLELPDKNNQPQVSRIPEGTYTVSYRESPSLGDSFHIEDVPNRDWILIHSGNYYTQIQGCVLVGRKFTDINADGQIDVTSSRDTLDELLRITEGFTLKIIKI